MIMRKGYYNIYIYIYIYDYDYEKGVIHYIYINDLFNKQITHQVHWMEETISVH